MLKTLLLNFYHLLAVASTRNNIEQTLNILSLVSGWILKNKAAKLSANLSNTLSC